MTVEDRLASNRIADMTKMTAFVVYFWAGRSLSTKSTVIAATAAIVIAIMFRKTYRLSPNSSVTRVFTIMRIITLSISKPLEPIETE